MRAAENERNSWARELADLEQRSRGLSQLIAEAEGQDAPDPYDRSRRDRSLPTSIAIRAQRFLRAVGASLTLEVLRSEWQDFESEILRLRTAAREAERRLLEASETARQKRRELERTAVVMREHGCRVP